MATTCDDVSSIAPRWSTELSDHLRRPRRGREQIRRVTRGLSKVGFKAIREKQRCLQDICEAIDECLEFVSGHGVSPIKGCSWFLHDRRNPTARMETAD